MTDPYADLAADLRDLAADLDALAGTGLPPLSASLHLSPRVPGADARVAAVDALGLALLGLAGDTHEVGDGSWRHRVMGEAGPLRVVVSQFVDSPQARALRAEVERLTAMRDGLAAQIAQAGLADLGQVA